MLTFLPFLTFNKSTFKLTFSSTISCSSSFIGVIQTVSQSFDKLITNISQYQLNKQQDEYGIYISNQIINSHYILYLENTKDIDDKYMSFFEKIIMIMATKVIFGDRSDYNRLSINSKQNNNELFLYLQPKNEIYKINSINDGRLEIGNSTTLVQTMSNDIQIKESALNIIQQLKKFLSLPIFSNVKYVSNLNSINEQVLSALKLRKQYQNFKTSMIDKATCMFKKQQLNTLLLHIEQLPSSTSFYTNQIVSTFQTQLKQKNQSLKQALFQQIYQRYKALNAFNFQQFRMQMSVKYQLIKYSVDQYLNDSSYYAQSILYRIAMDFCQPLFNTLKQQLDKQIEIKECLTNEVDEQINICQSLNKEIERLNRRIDDMANIDEVLKQKQNITRELQAKVDRLRSSEILLEGENLKKGKLIEHLEEKIKEKTQLQKSLYDQINKKTNELLNLQKLFKQSEKDKEQLSNNLKRKTDESNQMRKLFHSAHEAKSVFEKKAQSQERCLAQFHNKLDDIKRVQKQKANMVINLNSAQFKHIKVQNIKFQNKIFELEKKLCSCNEQNKKLKLQIHYFQKLFNQNKQRNTPSHPLVIIQQNSDPSSDRKRQKEISQQKFILVQGNFQRSGQQWINSSRKQWEKSISSVNKLETNQSKTQYF